jgi:hypothetical protein
MNNYATSSSIPVTARARHYFNAGTQGTHIRALMSATLWSVVSRLIQMVSKAYASTGSYQSSVTTTAQRLA